MCNQVTKRYISSIQTLKENQHIKSMRQFCIKVDFLPQSLSLILKGERDVTIDLLRKTFEHYPISAQYIFTGIGDMFIKEKSEENIPSEVICEEKIDNIIYVPHAAQAGYVDQVNEQDSGHNLEKFTLPDFKYRKGEHRCFDIAGDSMEPTLFSGDKVVCSIVDHSNTYMSLRNNYVYVIVLDSGIVVKRVINKIRESGELILQSDHKYYDAYNVDIREVKEIWRVEVKISPFSGSPSNMRNNFQEELEMLKSTINSQSKSIEGLNQTIEKLLRQNRASMVY